MRIYLTVSCIAVLLGVVLATAVQRDKDKNPQPPIVFTSHALEVAKDLNRVQKGDLIVLEKNGKRTVRIVTTATNGVIMMQNPHGGLADRLEKTDTNLFRIVHRNETFDYRYFAAKFAEEVAGVEGLK